MAIDGVSLGDKLHRNFTDMSDKIGNMYQGREALNQSREALDIKKREARMEELLAAQRFQAQQGQLDWESDFRRAFARGMVR